MVTNTEGLPADELTAASDPISCRQQFWDALALADESLAVGAAMRVRPPLVEIQRFDFEDVEESSDRGFGQGKGQGPSGQYQQEQHLYFGNQGQ